jgi:hypothetical protein
VWTLFPVFETTDRRRITRTANHIVRETRAARAWPGFPEDAIAIAENGGGDLLIVRGKSEDGEFGDHETGGSEPVDVDWG